MELSSQSKILPHGKVKLVDEYLLEGIQTVLLVEDKHCLLVVDGVNRTETQRTVAVGYQNGVAGDAGRAFVAVRKCLDIRQEHQRQQRLLEYVLTAVYQVAGIMQGLANLKLIVQWMIASW